MVVRDLHAGAMYHFNGSTYSVDEQYSGEGCSTERPMTRKSFGRFVFSPTEHRQVQHGL